jgi:LPXTG-site transpeptidase (sortase) family protein
MPGKMRSRLIAGGLGAAFAVAIYSGLSLFAAGPGIGERANAMPQVALQVPPATVHLVDFRPARLVIPAIGVDAKIEAQGLDSHRNLATPADYRDVAWYKLGPMPGLPGNAVMNGHVNWWTGDAVFTHLTQIKAGDEVRVIRADGVVVTFTVTAKRTVDAKARVASLFAPASAATLTLITCSGTWNPLTQSDTERLLVSASRA